CAMHRQRDFLLLATLAAAAATPALGRNADPTARTASTAPQSTHRSAKHCLCPGSLPFVGQYARPRDEAKAAFLGGVGMRGGRKLMKRSEYLDLRRRFEPDVRVLGKRAGGP